MSDRLAQQIAFLVEVDKLKDVLRRSYVIASRRFENDAEHSWHLALAAVVLNEHAPAGVDLTRVLKMVLLHDLVEIDAGDTYAYDEAGRTTQEAREQAAADRVFALLPAGQDSEFRELWEEFEARQTPSAQFAAALDRLQPLLLNYHTQGKAWQEHGIRLDQVLERNRPLVDGAPVLWPFVEALLDDAVSRGYLLPARETGGDSG